MLRTGKALFDVEFVLLHQQREMNFLKAEMGEVKAEVGEVKADVGEITRMLRLLVKDAAQVCHMAACVCVASDMMQLGGDVC